MRNKEESMKIIREAFLELGESFISGGFTVESLERIVKKREFGDTKQETLLNQLYSKRILIFTILTILLATTIVEWGFFEKIVKNIHETRCIVTNNYFIWEFTRPLSNCDFCRNIDEAMILQKNVTRREFEPYAYSSRPIIVKGAASHWRAGKIFDIKFFRKIYENIEDSYVSYDDENCQFLQFKSNFENLRDVLEMSDERALNLEGQDSWYVGWKNCHPGVLELINRYYEKPHFLPDDAEIPATSYIFLGYEQGAVMHLDYIPRLMWQGQIIGSKTWSVAPTPECDNVCKSFNFTVDTGDVVLLDTRIWYHGTYVNNGLFSLTITSEYG